MPDNERVPGYYTRQQAAEFLGVSPQRVSAIAKRDGWLAYQVGRSNLYDAEDIHVSHVKMQAQKAWRILGIPRRWWGAWWLADVDEIEYIRCPACGETAYAPAGDMQWSGQAACPSCGWRAGPLGPAQGRREFGPA